MKSDIIHTVLLLVACLVGASRSLPAAEVEPVKTSGITTIGIYGCYNGMPSEAIPFFKACGYNTYQRWDMAWTKQPEHQAEYYAEVATDIQRMQAAGFKVFVITSLNMRERRPGEPEGADEPQFDPNDEALVRHRMTRIAAMVRKLAMADGFTVFAGDPGGHPRATPARMLSMTRDVVATIRKEAPQAAINVNTWAIAAWDHFPSPFTLAFWEKESQLTRALLSRPDVVGPGVGLEFPLHNYYRSLARKCYVDADRPLELYPNRAEVEAFGSRGVKRLWGWPYFLVDECDDGYSPGTAGLSQAETRYVKDLVDTARRLGLNGLIANVFPENILAESLNVYAFARFCREPSATCAQVLRDFAGFISEPATAGDLMEVLHYIENRSTWQAGMPEKYRLPNFDTASIHSAADARAKLSKVVVRERGGLPLVDTPATWVKKIDHRLEMLIAQDAKQP